MRLSSLADGKVTEVTGVEMLVAIGVAVGLVGVVVPVVPGAVLIWAAILAWGIYIGTTSGWAVVAVATALVACGQVVKYTIPGKRLRARGVPNRSLVIGGLLAIVGFFVIPVVGLIIGFVMGVYASELQRVGPRAAWPSTTAALRAAGTSTLIELMSALLATGVWIIGVLAT